ncbi:methylenetetrahydrofolate reductase [Dyadobacter sp. CY261]|uniref:methylenetetrahydrofolate reductase n=1 Tax=Dyadobacter sp. CY261 TaxID=2907203 RepID=UPI001F3D58E9|nr:methylenetetrahydrofolate reductase [Dyadobacter sp. CY261]MCF0072867.1 methylenetetrahydrofolate reductase [Dyadobacter sp. CY261]
MKQKIIPRNTSDSSHGRSRIEKGIFHTINSKKKEETALSRNSNTIMFLQKIKSAESGVMLYGITPPKAGTAPERVAEIAQRTVDRLSSLDIDALVVYDVQDESARTTEERPFPFINALDPLAFASEHLGQLNIPKIIYRPAGKFSPTELTAWLEELHGRQFYPVFVGVPAPDFPVKTSLPEAYQIWEKHRDTSVIGAVTIPERHEVLKDEDVRILDKMNCGVSYFISQCVFNLDYAKQVVEDLYASCQSKQIAPPTIIFTITACGSEKTLDFMTWLGIHIPDQLKQELKAAEDMLEKSVGICLEIVSQLTAFCLERNIPFGFNIESVAIRKAEIEASIDMARAIGEILKENGLRKPSENLIEQVDPELG